MAYDKKQIACPLRNLVEKLYRLKFIVLKTGEL